MEDNLKIFKLEYIGNHWSVIIYTYMTKPKLIDGGNSLTITEHISSVALRSPACLSLMILVGEVLQHYNVVEQ